MILRKKNDIRVVLYHGIGRNDNAVMRNLKDEICPMLFEHHIDFLNKNYIIKNISQVHEIIKNQEYEKLKKPLCVITFDDGLNSVYDVVEKYLFKRKIPASIYLNSCVIDNLNMLWHHKLSYLITKLGISNVITYISYYSGCIISKYKIKTFSDLFVFLVNNFSFPRINSIITYISKEQAINFHKIAKSLGLYLNSSQIAELQNYGIDFGNHTRSHYVINRVFNENTKTDELKKCVLYNKIRDNNTLAIPFGVKNYYNDEDVKIILSMGYSYVVEVGTGLNLVSDIQRKKLISRTSVHQAGNSVLSLFYHMEIKPLIKRIVYRIKKN